MASEAIVNVTLGETVAREIAGKLRAALCKLAGYAATAQSENTRDWMDGLVEYLNEAAIVANEDTVFVLHRSNADGAMWITARDLSCFKG